MILKIQGKDIENRKNKGKREEGENNMSNNMRLKRKKSNK